MGAKTNGFDVDKVRRLLEAGRDLHQKLGAVLDECDELIGGGAGIGAKLKQFQAAFDGSWGRRYAHGQAGRYVWRFAVDVPNQKRLLKMLGLEELTARASRYIANDDPFLVRQRHPFGLFVSGINQYAAEGDPIVDLELDSGAPPADCRHTPRCGTDYLCTQKKRAELRA